MTDYQVLCEINAKIVVAAGILDLAGGMDNPNQKLPHGTRPAFTLLQECSALAQALMARMDQGESILSTGPGTRAKIPESSLRAKARGDCTGPGAE